jgi:hypothetical protein
MPKSAAIRLERATLCRRPRVTLVIAYAEAELEERRLCRELGWLKCACARA